VDKSKVLAGSGAQNKDSPLCGLWSYQIDPSISRTQSHVHHCNELGLKVACGSLCTVRKCSSLSSSVTRIYLVVLAVMIPPVAVVAAMLKTILLSLLMDKVLHYSGRVQWLLQMSSP
jgi:hypothetical protein